MVERRAARFVTSNYSREPGTVTSILQNLGWPTLETRRQGARLILLYKIIHAIGTFTVKIKQTNSTVQVKNQVSTLQQVLPHTRPKYIGQWCLDDALRKPVPVCDRSWNRCISGGCVGVPAVVWKPDF
jgi:hypothetical protein